MLAEVTNSFDWWATTGGVLGVLVFFGLAAIAVVLREWWQVHKPHRVAMLKAAVAKEESQCKLFDTLRETEPAKVALQEQQTRLIAIIHGNQADHARDCHRTDSAVASIVPTVEKIAKHLGVE